jgi:hypothetical protein
LPSGSEKEVSNMLMDKSLSRPNTAGAQRRHSSLRSAFAVPPKREQTMCWNQIFLVEMQKTEAGPGLKSIKKHEVPSASTFDLLLFGPSMAF